MKRQKKPRQKVAILPVPRMQTDLVAEAADTSISWQQQQGTRRTFAPGLVGLSSHSAARVSKRTTHSSSAHTTGLTSIVSRNASSARHPHLWAQASVRLVNEMPCTISTSIPCMRPATPPCWLRSSQRWAKSRAASRPGSRRRHNGGSGELFAAQR